MQRAPSLAVQAMLTEANFAQAALEVDGLRRDALANPDPEAAPWIVEWEWADAGEGPHTLAVVAQSPRGEWLTSVPVTVTVVPPGILAFASNRDGAQAVYTMQTDGREVTRWTSGPGDARQPAWRPDGVLAYVAEPGAGRAVIRQIAVPGGGGTELFPGRDPAWSPTGRRLAFAATTEEVSQVFTALPAGGAPFQVTEEEAYAGQPAWSPDGKRLAHVAQRDGNWDIWVVKAGGDEPLRLTEDAAMDWAPAWSPDGSQLAFVSNRGGNHQIYTMRDDGRGVKKLTGFELGAEAPAWSPDGFWLAFVAYTGEGEGVNAREIHLMRVDGRDQTRLTYNAFDDSLPDWSLAP
jgi:dipeptidyl aminopeptidase/acylaminoacyl peptidase